MFLETKNLTKKYGAFVALSSLNCELQSGELIGLAGSNGAGKSTFLKLLATLTKPTSGDILLNGKSIIKNPKEMQKVIGYLPQNVAAYPNLNAIEFLGYIASLKGMKKSRANEQILHLLKVLHLENVSNRHLSDFSGGMKQRVGIACALLGNPQIIIVDEPTTGLDPEERIAFRNILSELAGNKIVILSTHIISDIEAVANRIMVLKNGKLLFNDTPKLLMQKAKGHVWEYTIFANESLEKATGISSMMQTESGIKVRQVGKEKPMSKAALVNANLEDACLFTMEEATE